VYSKTGIWALKNRVTKAKVVPKTAGVTKKFGKEGKQSRVVNKKAPRYYPTTPVHRPLYVRKTARPPAIRKTLQPGAVVIILSGRFRGKRVVLLKTLPTGLLLITGPYKINGVPLRRVNPAYVITTSTKVDLTGVDVKKFDDAYFRRPTGKSQKKEKTAEKFFEGKQGSEAPKKVIDPNRKADQKTVDAVLLATIKKTPTLHDYLNAKFSLTNGQYPHEMKF